VGIEPVLPQDALLAVSLQEDSNTAGDTYRDGSPATLSLGDSLILAVAARLAVPVVTFDRHWNYLFSKGLLPPSIPNIVVP
jgi:PIN domain nuclease of toxin-antitoxin system